MKEYIKIHAVSFGKSFVANFFTTLGLLVMAIPQATLENPTTYKWSFAAGIIYAAGRSAIKAGWEAAFPQNNASLEG